MQAEFPECDAWLFQLSNLLESFEVPVSLRAAVNGLSAVGVDVEMLLFIIEQQRPSMRAKLRLYALAVSEDHALAIHVYTLENPSVYNAINMHMSSLHRSTADQMPSKSFLACIPFIKFLDVALCGLPASHRFRGRVYRGVKWVFPSPSNHEPERHFFQGQVLHIFGFKSASKKHDMMFHDKFCGHIGARSIFTIDAIEGFDIALFSRFPEEAEVLFRPTSGFEVQTCCKYNDPLMLKDPTGGFPDSVVMRQLSSGINYLAAAQARPAPAMAAPLPPARKRDIVAGWAAQLVQNISEKLAGPGSQVAPPRRCASTLQHTRAVYCVAWNGDGSALASGGDDGELRVWSGVGFRDCTILKGHTGRVYCAAFHPGGTYLASASIDKSLRVWGGPGYGQCVSILRSDSEANCVAWGLEGSVLVSGWDDRLVRLWTGQKWQTLVGVLNEHTDWVLALAVSNDGRRLASGSRDKTIRVWEGSRFEKCLATLEGHTHYVRSVCWSCDGSLLASGSFDGTVRLWGGPGILKCLAVLGGHTSLVFSVAFSGCGSLLASASEDRTIRVWGGEGHQTCLETLEGHALHGVTGLAWGGRFLASASDDSTVKVWKS